MKKIITILCLLVICFYHINPVFAVNTHSIDLELDSSQCLSITDASQTGLDITGDITIEFWWKPETSSAFTWLLGKYLISGNQRSYGIYYNSGSLHFSISDDGTGVGGHITDLGESWTPSDGTWYHITITYDASAGQAITYIDGSYIGDNTGYINSIFNGSSDLIIGGANGSGNVDGLMDDVRIWNDVRTSTEISDNYQQELVGNEANLQGYWKLNNSLLDETSNDNDLTNNNSAVFSSTVPFVGEEEARRIIIIQ